MKIKVTLTERDVASHHSVKIATGETPRTFWLCLGGVIDIHAALTRLCMGLADLYDDKQIYIEDTFTIEHGESSHYLSSINYTGYYVAAINYTTVERG